VIDEERVLELARMVRVELSAAEVGALRSELSSMLEFAAGLEAVDVENTPEWRPPPPEGRPLRADVPTTPLPREKALALSPASKDGYFQVPRTLDEG